jgi:hypothetical protein
MMGGARGTFGEQRNSYRVWVRRPEAKRRLGKPSLIWGVNIKMGFK